MSIEELTKLVESMNQRMIGMQEFMKDQAQEIDELRRELKTTTTSSISTGSVTRSAVDDKETKKQLAKDAAETAKLAKEAVPKLLMATPGNYEKWKERLQEVFKLRSYREIAKFLSGIGLESVTGIVKKEEVKVGSSSSSSTPISTHAAPTISDEAAENFFAFLTSKLDDEFGSIVREANKCEGASLRLWGGANSSADAWFNKDISDEAKTYAQQLTQPYCGPAADQAGLNWLENISAMQSVAIVSLRRPDTKISFGLLVLGSHDPLRFSSDLATDFLMRIGQTASAALIGTAS